jgi:hypothetical protein
MWKLQKELERQEYEERVRRVEQTIRFRTPRTPSRLSISAKSLLSHVWATFSDASLERRSSDAIRDAA